MAFGNTPEAEWAGDEAGVDANGHFPDEERTYVHDLFETPEQCDEARRRYPVINCSRWVTFSRNGRVSLVVTDIINGGTYAVQGGKVRIDIPASAEVTRPLSFTVSPKTDTLVLDNDNSVWRRQLNRADEP